MLIRLFVSISVLILLSGCASVDLPTEQPYTNSPYAVTHRTSDPVQCVPYARQVSGIQIRGDAHTWWDKAAPDYDRGHTPRPGAVLVLARTPKMTSGHLAVVKDIVSPRQINVTHSNWGSDRSTRRVIYDSMRVEDISARNDWTSVRFWNIDKNVFGFPYAAKGFIYP